MRHVTTFRVVYQIPPESYYLGRYQGYIGTGKLGRCNYTFRVPNPAKYVKRISRISPQNRDQNGKFFQGESVA